MQHEAFSGFTKVSPAPMQRHSENLRKKGDGPSEQVVLTSTLPDMILVNGAAEQTHTCYSKIFLILNNVFIGTRELDTRAFRGYAPSTQQEGQTRGETARFSGVSPSTLPKV